MPLPLPEASLPNSGAQSGTLPSTGLVPFSFLTSTRGAIPSTSTEADNEARPIFYRRSSNNEIQGPFDEERVQNWYQQGFFSAGLQFRIGNQDEFVSLATLRRLNGTACPFSPTAPSNGVPSPSSFHSELHALSTTVHQMRADKDRLAKMCDMMANRIRDLELENTRISQQLQTRLNNSSTPAMMNKQSQAYIAVKPKGAAGGGGGGGNVQKNNNTNNISNGSGSGVESKIGNLSTRVFTKSPSPSGASSGANDIKLPMLYGHKDDSVCAAPQFLLETLMKAYEKCDRSRRSVDARSLIGNNIPTFCAVCNVKLPQLSIFLAHVTSKKHVAELGNIGSKISQADVYFWLDFIKDGKFPEPV